MIREFFNAIFHLSIRKSLSRFKRIGKSINSIFISKQGTNMNEVIEIALGIYSQSACVDQTCSVPPDCFSSQFHFVVDQPGQWRSELANF